MINESPEGKPMRDFKAIYLTEGCREESMTLMAHSLSHATVSAIELIPRDSKFLRIYENPDWS